LNSPTLGTLSSELFSLTRLKQLDLNDNKFSGSVANDIQLLENLEFLQLHENEFSGTISSAFGNLSKLKVLTIQSNEFTGTMPTSICNLRDSLFNDGVLSTLRTDCSPKINCSCCTNYCP